MVSRYAYAWFVDPSPVTEGLGFEQSVFTLTLLWGKSLGLDTKPWQTRRAPVAVDGGRL